MVLGVLALLTAAAYLLRKRHNRRKTENQAGTHQPVKEGHGELLTHEALITRRNPQELEGDLFQSPERAN